MTATGNEWLSARVVHLTGGCRAINGFSPDVQLKPALADGNVATFVLPNYTSLYSACKNFGLSICGIDFYSSNLEASGQIPPDWRVLNQTSATIWPSAEEAIRWSHIGHSAFTQKDMRLWDISNRISHQIRVCAWRVRQISEAYKEQLLAQTLSNNYSNGTRFNDEYTWLAYLSVQSFLVDACVLRDYLIEFYTSFVIANSELMKKGPITSIGGLIKRGFHKVIFDDAVSLTLQKSSISGGWLHKLGAYRDLVVHSAPLAKAQGQLCAIMKDLLFAECSLPSIHLPIPCDPEDIFKDRASGEHLKTIEDQYQIFVNNNHDQSPDGLTYCHAALGELSMLTHMLGTLSPLPPTMPHIDSSMIIGEIKITNR